jgi:gamma-glutamylcyclotransferase (GGCT)/AIG2-like uncharacterized protein YtfP
MLKPMRSVWFTPGSVREGMALEGDIAILRPAFLPDRVRGGTGELRRSLGHVVPGYLVEVTEAGARRISASLSLATQDAVVVLTADARAHRVRACFAETGGAGQTETATIPSGVFVYGTLREGEEREGLMKRPGLRRRVEARVPGRLVDLCEYPGLVSAVHDGETVLGELHEYEDPRALLRVLDEVEDFFGYEGEPRVDAYETGCSADSLYRRSLVEIPTGEECTTLAWVYVYVGSDGGERVLASGDWKRR